MSWNIHNSKQWKLNTVNVLSVVHCSQIDFSTFSLYKHYFCYSLWFNDDIFSCLYSWLFNLYKAGASHRNILGNTSVSNLLPIQWRTYQYLNTFNAYNSEIKWKLKINFTANFAESTLSVGHAPSQQTGIKYIPNTHQSFPFYNFQL